MLKVGTLFSGVGTPEQSLKHLNIEHETIFACEIDKYARTTYLANNQKPNTFYNDVTKLDANKYLNQIDILIGGFPCQAFSIAGKQLGFEDTRGTLFFDCARIVKESQPKVFVFENVKGLISHDKPKEPIELNNITYKKGYPSHFNKEYDGHKKGIGKTLYTIETVLLELGYPKIYWEVVNTKDYGIPQNRERIYIIGFRDEVDFEFAPKQELKLRLKDMLEDSVDEKYLLKQEQVKNIQESNYNQKRDSIMSEDVEFSKTLLSRDYKDPKVVQIKTITPKRLGNIFGDDKGTGFAGNVWDENHICPTLNTMQGGYRMPRVKTVQNREPKVAIEEENYNYIFRKLTPRECFRLQGFDDSFIFADKMSDSQLYKQAGNGMSRNILDMILTQIITSYTSHMEKSR